MAAIIHRQYIGTGTGTEFYDEPFAGLWRLYLDWVPSPGNALLLISSMPYGAHADAADWGGNAGTFAFTAANTTIISWWVGASPATYMDVQGHFRHGSSILVEIAGLTDINPDKHAYVAGGPTATITTPTTAATTTATQYWLNTFVYYNATPGNDFDGTAATNGYSLVNGGTATAYQQTGMVWPSGSPTHSPQDYAYGILITDKFVASIGTAGGAITDSLGRSYYWEACAITFPCLAAVGPTRSRPDGLLESATRCSAVLVTRADGTRFGLTDSQWPFVWDGVTFQTAQGADASNVHQETGTGVGDLEVSTLLDDALNYVTAADVRGTRYNNSFWLLFLIDYMDPGNGIMILNRYRCAKWSGTDTSMKFVLKGLLSILDQATGRTYSPQCDVARFGDLRCDPGQTIRAAMTDSLTCYSVGIVDALFTTDWTGSARGAGFYTFGDATFTAGANTGLEGQIKQHTVLTPAAWSGVATYALGDYSTESGTTYISLQPHNLNNDPATSPAWWLAMAGMPASIARLVWRTPPPYVVAIADVADVCFGCDRRQLTCSGVPNTDATTNPSTTNIENFHGYYLPSPDQLNVVGRPI